MTPDEARAIWLLARERFLAALLDPAGAQAGGGAAGTA